MSKYVMIVFNDEESAYEGSREMAELNKQGFIGMFGQAVVTKTPLGELQIHETETRAPGFAKGVLIGGLFGALGGPAGILAGAAAGSLTGSLLDLYDLSADQRFIQEEESRLLPGQSAVVAEITEGSPSELDHRMAALGGVASRRDRGEFEDEPMDRDYDPPVT